VASLSQGRTAAAQCGLFTYKSVPVIFEPPCSIQPCGSYTNIRSLREIAFYAIGDIRTEVCLVCGEQ